jgi:hypothetical protein
MLKQNITVVRSLKNLWTFKIHQTKSRCLKKKQQRERTTAVGETVEGPGRGEYNSDDDG